MRRHVRSRPQAQAHRAVHPRADQCRSPSSASTTTSGGRRLTGVAKVGGEQDHAGRIRRRRCATSRSGCAGRWARNFDPAMFDNPGGALRAARAAASTSGCCANEARDQHFRVSDAQLASGIVEDPAFQEGQVLAPAVQAPAVAQAGVAERRSRRASGGNSCSAARRSDLPRRHRCRVVGRRVLNLVEQQRDVEVAERRRRRVREGRQGGRRAGEGVLRRQRRRVPDAGGGEVRVCRPHAGCAAGQVAVTPEEVEGAVRARLKTYTQDEQRRRRTS